MGEAPEPLAGRRVVVTRAREQAAEMIQALTSLGAEVVAAPTIQIEPLEDLSALAAALAALARYRWVIFTSQTTVRVVGDALTRWGITPDRWSSVRVAAIGPATAAALAHRGIAAGLVPERFVAEAVVEAIAGLGGLSGQRILLPRALEARDVLPEGLRARGALVDVIPVYRTVAEGGDGRALAREIAAGRIDVVTFTSSSTVRHFVDLVGQEAATSGRFVAAAIGPVTAATARGLGLSVAVEAKDFTVPGLVAALVAHYGARASA